MKKKIYSISEKGKEHLSQTLKAKQCLLIDLLLEKKAGGI